MASTPCFFSISLRQSSRTGSIFTASSWSMDTWDNTSNSRMDSTSSPKNSIRTGFTPPGWKKSTISPRTLNSPLFSTNGERVKPLSDRQASKNSRSKLILMFTGRISFSRTERGMTVCRPASKGTTRIKGSPVRSRLRISSLSPDISFKGESSS